MTPAATAASGLRSRLLSARLVVNASSSAVSAARSACGRPEPSLPAATSLPGAQQQQRHYAYAISGVHPPASIADVWGTDIAPEPVASENDARPEVEDRLLRRQRRPDRPPLDIPRTRSTKKIDYVNGLRMALRTREVDNVIQCMIAGAHDATFVSSIQPVTFTEMLRLVSSSRQLHELQEALEHSWWVRGSDLPSLDASMGQLMKALQIMVAIRRSVSSVPLSLLDYKLMLRCAASVADKSVALDLWNKMREDGVQPDTDCYNAFMHAILWERRQDRLRNNWTKPLSFRVDQYYLSARRPVSRLSYAPSLGGYETQVKTLFNNILEEAHLGDENTIGNLILAFAREGNLPAVRDTLRRVWNIHVEELMMTGKQRSPPKRFGPSAPLRPTGRLLYAVAHAFGTNSEVPTALRLTDFISTAYGLRIPMKVWSELFTWTHVQSAIRSGRFKRAHRPATKLPLAAPEQLWQTLTRAPYNVRPTMKMFHLSVGNLTKHQRYDVADQRIREGVRLYRAGLARARAAVRALEGAKREVADGRAPRRSLSALLGRRNALVAAVRRDRALVRRWCQMYTARGNGFGFVQDSPLQEGGRVGGRRRVVMYDAFPDWAYVKVPDFLREFEALCPRTVKYRTHTGVVELELRPAFTKPLPPKVAAKRAARAEREGAVQDEGQAAEEFWERARERMQVSRLLSMGRRL